MRYILFWLGVIAGLALFVWFTEWAHKHEKGGMA